MEDLPRFNTQTASYQILKFGYVEKFSIGFMALEFEKKSASVFLQIFVTF